MKPWEDAPTHPGCGGPGVTLENATWNHRAKPGDTLACPACGGGWVGTPEEVARAEKAETAYDRLLERQSRASLRKFKQEEFARRLKEAVERQS